MSKFDKLEFAMRKNQERAAAASMNIPIFRIPNGKSTIRIIPAATDDDPGNFFRYVGWHYNVSPTTKRPMACRTSTDYLDEPCPICEHVAKLRAEGRTKEADDMSVTNRYVLRVIVRGEEEKGPQQMDCPITVFNQLGEIIKDEATWGDVTDLKSGRDMLIVRQGEGFSTRYFVQALPKTNAILPRKDDAMAMMEELPSINDLFSVMTYEELDELVNGKPGGGASGFGPTAKRSASSSSWGDEEDDDDTSEGEEKESWGDSDDDDTPADEVLSDESDGWVGFSSEEEEDDDVPFEEDEPASVSSALTSVRKAVSEQASKSKKTAGKKS